MPRKWLYISIVVVTFIVAVACTGLYYIYHSPSSEAIVPDDIDARIEVLIDQMIHQDTYSLFHEDFGPSMRMLAEIGPRAVPKLIYTIGGAREEYISRELASRRLPSDSSIYIHPIIIQTRAVMVLGSIGDDRALAILLYIKTHHDQCPLRCEVDNAIRSIQNNKSK